MLFNVHVKVSKWNTFVSIWVCCNRTEPKSTQLNRTKQKTEQTKPDQRAEYVRMSVCCTMCPWLLLSALDVFAKTSRIIQEQTHTHTNTNTRSYGPMYMKYKPKRISHNTLSFVVVVARVRLLLSRHFFGVVFSIILVVFYLYSPTSSSIVYSIYSFLIFQVYEILHSVCECTPNILLFISLFHSHLLFQYLWVRCLTLAYQIFFASVSILWRTTTP